MNGEELNILKMIKCLEGKHNDYPVGSSKKINIKKLKGKDLIKIKFNYYQLYGEANYESNYLKYKEKYLRQKSDIYE